MTWRAYPFGSVFRFVRGMRWKTADHIEGEIPYISSSGRDNGIAAYVTPPDFMTVHRNRMTLANSGTVGTVFFHPYDFVASDHCMVVDLVGDEELDEDLFLFLRPVLESIRHRYNFGREINQRRLEREKVALPAKTDGTPDWTEMRREIVRLRANVHFTPVGSLTACPNELRDVTWRDYRIDEVFNEILTGRCGNAQGLLSEGADLPYIGAKRGDYGVVSWVSAPLDDRLVFPGPCIAMICDGQGSVGYSTFIPFDKFVGTTTVKFGYHPEIDAEVAAFLTTILDQNRPQFSFGRKWGARLAGTIVSLPSTADGAPDFDFMRRYIRSLRHGDRLGVTS